MTMIEPAPLRFYVPEPAVRPGGQPDFSNVRIPEAGSVRGRKSTRPGVDPRSRLFDHSPARPQRRCRRPPGRHAEDTPQFIYITAYLRRVESALISCNTPRNPVTVISATAK